MVGGKEQTTDCLGFFAWEQSCFLPEGEQETLAVDDVLLSPSLTGIEDNTIQGYMEIRINAMRGLEQDFFDDGFSDFDELADEEIKLKQVVRAKNTSTYSFDVKQPFSQKIIGVKSVEQKPESLWLKILDTQKEYLRDNELKLKVLVGIFPLHVGRESFVEIKALIHESLPVFEEIPNCAVVATCCGLVEPYMLIKDNEVTAKGKLCAKIALRQANGEYNYMDADKNVEWNFAIPGGKVVDLKDVSIRISQLAYREEGWFKVEGEAILPVVLEADGQQEALEQSARTEQEDEPVVEQVAPPEPEDMKDDFKVDWLQDWAECKDLSDCDCHKAQPVVSEAPKTREQDQDEVGELANEIEEDLAVEAGYRKLEFMELDGDLEPVLEVEQQENTGEPIEFVQPLVGGSGEIEPVLDFGQMDVEPPEPEIQFAVPLEGRQEEVLEQAQEQEIVDEQVDVLAEQEEVPQLTSLIEESSRSVGDVEAEVPVDAAEEPIQEVLAQPEPKETTKRVINYVQDKPARLQLNPEQATWKFYFVKPGETIESISDKVGVRVEEILARNRLSRVTIEQSKVIMIPVAK